jgi:hypothetical protein
LSQIILLAKLTVEKIFASFLVRILLLSLLTIVLGLSLYENSITSLSFLLAFSPYLFLFSTSDMIKDEMERGYLDNRILIIASKSKVLVGKIIGVLFINIFFLSIMLVVLSILGILKGERLLFNERVGISLLIGTYYCLAGLFLGFFFKGASNALVIVFSQILILFLFPKISPGFFINIEKGIFSNYSEKIMGIIFLILFPNFLLGALKRYIYVLIINISILFLLILNLYRRMELKKG